MSRQWGGGGDSPPEAGDSWNHGKARAGQGNREGERSPWHSCASAPTPLPRKGKFLLSYNPTSKEFLAAAPANKWGMHALSWLRRLSLTPHSKTDTPLVILVTGRLPWPSPDGPSLTWHPDPVTLPRKGHCPPRPAPLPGGLVQTCPWLPLSVLILQAQQGLLGAGHGRASPWETALL